MRIIGISFVNSILILFVILIHKVLFRVLHFGYENLLFYWGTFIAIYFLLNLLTNKILLSKKS
ncbi:bacteriocin-like WGxF protein [Listeria ivanovii]|uniref:bacteriocin-like WGxF protein n=1 Tax=Listeria ivanovii TaxID=1638 RepID=UPI0003EC8F8A|nr:bacteriocin-like WGxF protein [Listeria ivanovii]AHI56624.1 hypothetical protein AX25_11185 [Listeria ivanovii WSLC3009]AIS66042.1 hypothetical protein JL52_11005 [Listeria ivanovii subsp. ivanovii]MBC1758915.1 bacteriocin-like WGxF protein [Listeria ivanovii]MBK3913937.1 bacteriocin-like WGxF protein [Listeria ivanovii subsp. ivanovii]MBK3921225.1 bacteriocin-like WGxF protein [Listeria ivanovii subsp. ivanovii]